MHEFYTSVDFRNHVLKNTRLELFSSNPAMPLEGRIWHNSDESIPYIRANSLDLPLIAKDDNFHNAALITTNEGSDELLVWDSSATSSYQFDKYRRITFNNFKAQFGTASNAFKTLNANSGLAITATGEDTFSIHGDNIILATRNVPAEKRMYLDFKVQAQKLFLAGPSSGADAVPQFRQILLSDLPSGIMIGYTKAEVDAFFDGESVGKKLVHWNNVVNKPTTFSPSSHTHPYEPELGNPLVDGYVLSSTIAGVRSWIEMTGGGGGYWSRTGTLITPVTSDDTLGINTIQEETLNNGIDVLSTVRVNTGKTPGLSRFKHGLEINYGQGIATLDNFTVHTNLYTAIVVNSNDNSLLLMNNTLGKIGFFNATPSAQSTGWTVTNHSEDKAYDITETTINEMARVLGTVITELKNKGLIGS